ncbi:MAG: peptide ABC transporter substrate-binding protein [Chloroflexi bacterium]|nr:MAG: peptide ABC transporter substrate-binding protein [Chloroflexota bacterium]
MIAVLLVLAMVLAACPAPAAAPAPEQPAAAATEPAAEEAAPAEEAAAAETPAAQEEAAAPADPMTTIYGEKLPDDARPYDEQVYRVACDITGNHTTFDFVVAVYQRFCGSDLFQDQLVNLDKDFNVIPNSAESWEVSEDGLTWTFHIKPGLQWSDGTPLTAYDWEATFRYAADPEHAWDFAWFYAGVLKNWNEAIAGEVPLEELGVKAVDDLTLEITTEVPWPPLPAMMQFSFVMSKKAMEEHGPYYNSDPATSVSAGPFMLESLEPGKQVVLVANPNYKGMRQPRISKIVGIYMNMSTAFAAFQNGEIEQIGYEWLTPADFEIILNDPVLSANYLRHYGDFRTDYLLFDTYNPPFNDVNVRKAFAKAIDRDAIVKNVYGEIKAMPAHAMLMPGYPSSDTEGALTEYQAYDCDAAKQHLADAGFPDGAGFPAQEMWLRNEGTAMQAVFQAVAASIADCLNIEIQVSNKDYKVYMDALNAKPTQITLGAISYGMDFLDPSNLLGIWLSTGRHSWKNDEFDRLVTEASSMVGDPEARDQMFRDAERILVDDVGGAFVAHRWQGDLFQPYVQGEGLRTPDSQGIAAWHWGNDWVWGDIYLAKSE